MGDMRAERHIPLFDKQLYTPQTLYLLPRDEGGLYNDLNYRLLRSFSVMADDRAQMATSACRDTARRVRQCKDDIVDVSDTACRVPTWGTKFADDRNSETLKHETGLTPSFPPLS